MNDGNKFCSEVYKDGNDTGEKGILDRSSILEMWRRDSKLPLEFTAMEDKEKWNSKTLRDCIDVEFSHNEIIALWGRQRKDENKHLIYRGEGWAVPDEYLGLHMNSYFGAVPESIWEGDSINILVEEYCDDIVCGLPKKKHDISGAVDGGKDEC